MRRAVGEILRIAIGGVLMLALCQAFLVLGIVPPCRVTSRSMEPTVTAGNRLVVDRTAFWLRTPRRWEIVVFYCPDQPTELCVKRVVGLPGEKIQLRDRHVLVDGASMQPPAGIFYGPAPGQ